MMSPKPRTLIDGLPFSTEGYERAKAILKKKYGKTSEVVNEHVQAIMNLPTIYGSNTTRIHEFYEGLLTHVQSLETMGKVAEINGYVRSTLDKLPGIRSDLVRLDEDWQDWKYHQLTDALGRWTERNPISNGFGRKEKNFNTHDEKQYKSRCVYCNKEEHKSNNCDTVKDIEERKKIMSKKQLCFNCTKGDHRAGDCKSRNCYNCNNRHHTSICNRPKKSERSPAMCSSSSGSVVFPILVVKVNGVKCRALVDNCSGSSYASSTLIELMKIKPVRKESRSIETLMHTTSRKIEIYKVKVSSVLGFPAGDGIKQSRQKRALDGQQPEI